MNGTDRQINPACEKCGTETLGASDPSGGWYECPSCDHIQGVRRTPNGRTGYLTEMPEYIARIEAMTTAVITGDVLGQTAAAKDMDRGEEGMLRAAASVIAGLFVALGPAVKMTPTDAWRTHLEYTNKHRSGR